MGYVGFDLVYVANKSDLRDRGAAYSGMSETTVVPGVTAFSVFADIENRGLKEAEGCNVSFYASLDTNITTSDHYLGYDALLPLLNGTFVDVSWDGTFPNITEGSYYIGWIIDVNDDVDEGHEENNQAYILTQLIVKTPGAPGGIPGYNVVLLVSIGSIISVIIVIRRMKRK
jgi:subtilase family serine protease